jgi:hypothetical protein
MLKKKKKVTTLKHSIIDKLLHVYFYNKDIYYVHMLIVYLN